MSRYLLLVVMILVLVIPICVNAAIITNIYEDFEDQNVGDINGILLGNAQIVLNGDHVLRLIGGSSTFVLGGISVPVNFSYVNTTIEFTLIMGNNGDGYFVHIVDKFNSSDYPGTISNDYEYEKELPSGYNGVVIGLNKYSSYYYLKIINNGTVVVDKSASYSFTGGATYNVKIEILNSTLTLYLNDTSIASINCSDIPINYIVIGALTRGISTGVDLWIDNLIIISDNGEEEPSTSTSTTTTPNENTTTSTTTSTTATNTSTTTPSDEGNDTGLIDKVKDWWNGLSMIQRIAVIIGGLIVLLIILKR